jgi:1,5-anhydro-D-fructose reductase (1,5-anhydro-D-mannitol-forming)
VKYFAIPSRPEKTPCGATIVAILPSHSTDLDAVLSDPRVNAAYVSTTNELHEAQTLAAEGGTRQDSSARSELAASGEGAACGATPEGPVGELVHLVHGHRNSCVRQVLQKR